MIKVTEDVIPHFQALLQWTKEGLSQSNLPYTYYQYMKLNEALESVIDSLSCTKAVDLPKLKEHQGTSLKIVVDNASLDKLRHHQDMIPVPLPML